MLYFDRDVDQGKKELCLPSLKPTTELLLRSRTSFVIAHRLSTIQNADMILVLDQGKIVQQGTHAELVEADGIYQQMVRLQTNNPIALSADH